MLWFPLALLTAVFSATEVAIIKARLTHLSSFEYAAYPVAYGLPLMLAVAFVAAPPEGGLPLSFWLTLAMVLPLNLLAYLCSMRAIALSPLSLTMPFMALSPMIVMVAGRFMLGEGMGPWGVAGIATVTLGGYVLNAETARHGALLEPFRALARDKGVRLMAFAGLILGVSVTVGKSLALQSSPLYAAGVVFSSHNALVLLVALTYGRARPRVLLAHPRIGLLLGAMGTAHVVLHFFAITMTVAAYMISVKRLSGLIGVVYGHLFFGEKHVLPRLAGATLMAAGVAMIALAG
ncbi:MAG: EamA family transporter [Desulfovibrionaceae bacterium]